ncbi:MAG: hypothetical protein ACK4RK_14890 [Gemmataceae bacterium]
MRNLIDWQCAGVALSVALWLTGCGQHVDSEAKGGKQAHPNHAHDHSHGAGPHGGVVADWAGGKFHIEFTVDHDQKQATVYVLKGDAQTAAPIKADKLLLSIKKPVFQVDLLAVPQDGDPPGVASRFVGTHDNLGVKQEFTGTVIGHLEGKQYAGDFEE